MSKLIPKYLNPSSTLEKLGDAATYAIPIYGTYRSIKDAIEDPDPFNIGLATLSAAGDIGTIFGVGEAINGVTGALKAGRVAKGMYKPVLQTVGDYATNVGKSRGTMKGTMLLLKKNGKNMNMLKVDKYLDIYNKAKHNLPNYEYGLKVSQEELMKTPLWNLQQAAWSLMPLPAYNAPKVLMGIQHYEKNNN